MRVRGGGGRGDVVAIHPKNEMQVRGTANTLAGERIHGPLGGRLAVDDGGGTDAREGVVDRIHKKRHGTR